MKPHDKYLKLVFWSEEDRRYVGSIPGWIDACCHGKDETEVYRELCRVLDEWIGIYQKEGRPLPLPTNRRYSGRFVLRTGPDIHRALAVRALCEGESLNAFVLKSLEKAVRSLSPENRQDTVQRPAVKRRAAAA
jgi:predicted HicB family RNase H-like nuclease